jgi:hypothetical protein
LAKPDKASLSVYLALVAAAGTPVLLWYVSYDTRAKLNMSAASLPAGHRQFQLRHLRGNDE